MTCKICHTPPLIRKLGKKKETYFFCPACGYIFKDSALFVSRDAEKKRYLAHNNDAADPGYLEFLEDFIARAVAPFRQPPASLLDFGSGPAPVLAGLLLRRGFRVATYDPYFDPDPAPLTGRYQAITLVEVAEHLKEPLQTFRLLVRLLLPGGILAVRTLYHPRDPVKFSRWWYRTDLTHVGFFSPPTMARLAETLILDTMYNDEKSICVFRKNGTLI